MKPHEIEKQSFGIIEQEAGKHGFLPAQWRVVSRMIHTSADFDYLKTVRIHPDALSAGINAIHKGCAIITDTNMARAGIRKKDAENFGCRIKCFMEDENVIQRAARNNTTRAAAAVDVAGKDMAGGIYAVGNAPTALLRLIELIGDGSVTPALVVGFPVGFVNAAESKKMLAALDFPHITNMGRKGGSAIAAAVVNALLLLASEKGA